MVELLYGVLDTHVFEVFTGGETPPPGWLEGFGEPLVAGLETTYYIALVNGSSQIS